MLKSEVELLVARRESQVSDLGHLGTDSEI